MSVKHETNNIHIQQKGVTIETIILSKPTNRARP